MTDLLLIGGATPEMLQRLEPAFTIHYLADMTDPKAWVAENGARIHYVATNGHDGICTILVYLVAMGLSLYRLNYVLVRPCMQGGTSPRRPPQCPHTVLRLHQMRKPMRSVLGKTEGRTGTHQTQ